MKKRMPIWMLGMCLGISLSVGLTACGRSEAATDPVGIEDVSEPETDSVRMEAVSELEDAKVPEGEEMVEFEGNLYHRSELSEDTVKWLEQYHRLPEEARLMMNYIPHELIPSYGADGDRAVTSETAAADILLTSAPELSLTDPLSSTLNRFAVQSGNYEWTVMEHGEAQSVAACGMHPLDSLAEQSDKLKVPHYNKMDAVLFTVSAVIQPDHLLVSRWDDSALGVTETEAEESLEYDDAGMIELRPGKVYEITATWSEERLKERGFWGTASYSFITE